MSARARLDAGVGALPVGEIAVGLTAVVAALREELRPLLSRLAAPRAVLLSGCRVHCGRLAGVPVLLACTGDGRLRAERGLSALLRAFPVARVVVVGVSGGLSPRLAPESLLVAREVIDGDLAAPAPDRSWTDRALVCRGTREGTALTHPRILDVPALKAEAWAALETSGHAAVDLESAAFAHVSAASGIPYVVIRAISDGAHEGMPFDLNRCRGPEGEIRRWPVVRYALCHPRVLPGLWRLRGRVARSAHKLADTVEELLGESR